MATLRISNIEAKADAGSPSIDEKVIVKNSAGDTLLIIDGKNTNSGITTIGVGGISDVITVDADNKVTFNSNTGISFGTDEVNINTGGSTRATVDSSGRLLIGTTTSSPVSVNDAGAALQVEGTALASSRVSILRRDSGTFGPTLAFGKTGGTGDELVANNDIIGRIDFAAGDGTNILTTAGRIELRVDGTPGTNDIPSLMNFQVREAGAGTPTTQMSLLPAGDLQFNSGYGSAATAYGCRAWVNFDGTGTVTIRGSGNVSSITDNNTGNYTLNFTTAMPDTNFAYVCSVGEGDHSSVVRTLSFISSTTSTLQILAEQSAGSNIDEDQIGIAIFR